MKQDKQKIAHMREDNTIQSIKAHLENVAKLCWIFAEEFGQEKFAYEIGLAHDIGKYSEKFQRKITEDPFLKVDHSTAGARELFQMKMPYGAFAVAGHHSGLPDGESQEESCLVYRVKKKILPEYSQYKEEITLNNVPIVGKKPFEGSFLTRMLFSCLVDADYLDTEQFMQKGAIKRGGYDNILFLKEKLDQYISGWLENKNQSSPINQERTKILKQSIEAGKGPKGLYSLTVPTGSGKTISSLAFALQHASNPKYRIKRIIYVIPYTSIIEQNAAVFRTILGEKNVVEHHSNAMENGNQEDFLQIHQLSTENWDAPLIVTTNVQFFESLYGNKPSICRKLHNIANSVIIFDEAQMIPLRYLKPCVRAIKELVEHYGVTAVLCTATQPALQKWFLPLQITEICGNNRGLFQVFRRTQIVDLGSVSEQQLLRKIIKHKQGLLIVNTKKRANTIFEKLQTYPGIENLNLFYLSTNMTPYHRSTTISCIKDCLTKEKPCLVVSTSLIEAGVDIDFPYVYRELTGLDSIIQAAGRCNREGKRSFTESFTFVFSFEDGYPKMLEKSIAMTKESFKKNQAYDSLEAIQYYFEQLYQLDEDYLDQKQIVRAFEERLNGITIPFRSVAEIFHLIEENTAMVIIPQQSEAEQWLSELEYKLSEGINFRDVLRKLGKYTVNMQENYYQEMIKAGMIAELVEGVAVLQNLSIYDKQVGLKSVSDHNIWFF